MGSIGSTWAPATTTSTTTPRSPTPTTPTRTPTGSTRARRISTITSNRPSRSRKAVVLLPPRKRDPTSAGAYVASGLVRSAAIASSSRPPVSGNRVAMRTAPASGPSASTRTARDRPPPAWISRPASRKLVDCPRQRKPFQPIRPELAARSGRVQRRSRILLARHRTGRHKHLRPARGEPSVLAGGEEPAAFGQAAAQQGDQCEDRHRGQVQHPPGDSVWVQDRAVKDGRPPAAHGGEHRQPAEAETARPAGSSSAITVHTSTVSTPRKNLAITWQVAKAAMDARRGLGRAA